MSRFHRVRLGSAVASASVLAVLVLAGCSHQRQAAHTPSSGPAPAAANGSTAPGGAGASFSAFHGEVPASFTSIQCSLDNVNGKPATSLQAVAADSTVTFRGWAGNGQSQPAEHFDLVLKSAQHAYAVPLTTGVERADVARALHSKAMATSGYDFGAKLSGVAAGSYAVYVVNPSDETQDCNLQRTLTVQ